MAAASTPKTPTGADNNSEEAAAAGGGGKKSSKDKMEDSGRGVLEKQGGGGALGGGSGGSGGELYWPYLTRAAEILTNFSKSDSVVKEGVAEEQCLKGAVISFDRCIWYLLCTCGTLIMRRVLGYKLIYLFFATSHVRYLSYTS